jgi:hypothetical protein
VSGASSFNRSFALPGSVGSRHPASGLGAQVPGRVVDVVLAGNDVVVVAIVVVVEVAVVEVVVVLVLVLEVSVVDVLVVVVEVVLLVLVVEGTVVEVVVQSGMTEYVHEPAAQTSLVQGLPSAQPALCAQPPGVSRSARSQSLAVEVKTCTSMSPSPSSSLLAMHGSGTASPRGPVQSGTATAFRKTPTCVGSPLGTRLASSRKMISSGSAAEASVASMATSLPTTWKP